MKASVAILTVDRKALLRTAVAGVLEQQFPKGEFEVLVVDNSRDGSQAWIVDAFPQRDDSGRALVRYLREPRPGLAKARNCAIDAAQGEFLAFLDDDETPCAGNWLASLVHALEVSGADGVFGPVHPRYAHQPLRYGSFADALFTRDLATRNGSDISRRYHEVGSGNSCFRYASSFCEPRTRFDERFDALGGEDIELFRRLVGRNCKFIWCGVAGVSEFVPDERLTFESLRARRFSQGQNRSRMQIETPARPGWLAFWMAAGAFQAAYHKTTATALGLFNKQDAADFHAIETFGGLGKVFWQDRFRKQHYARPVTAEDSGRTADLPTDWKKHPLIRLRKVDFMGSPLDLLTMAETVELARVAMAERRQLHHTVVNVSKLVMMTQSDELYADVTGADIVNVDGMGVVWGARLLGIKVPERVAGIDLMECLFRLCAVHGFRPYLLGAEQEVLDRTLAQLHREFPSIEIAGHTNGYFRVEEENSVVDRINSSKADCLFVAMPTPKKERFLAKYRDRIRANFIMGVGGSFDVYAGKVRRAPVIVQWLGLEWLFRVAQEPRRLWRRYYTTNTQYAVMLWRELRRQQRSKTS